MNDTFLARWEALSRPLSDETPGVGVLTLRGARDLAASILDAVADEYDQTAEVYDHQANQMRPGDGPEWQHHDTLVGKALAFESASRDLRLRAQVIREHRT